jgi:MFS family permease
VLTCLTLIAVATSLMALVPGYSTLGWMAPATLVGLRLVQGFAVGGMLPAASVLLTEAAEAGRRGVRAGYAIQGVQAGQLAAAAVFLPLAAVFQVGQFQTWGWRIPFLVSAIFLVPAIRNLRRIPEPAGFGDVRFPLLSALRESPGNMVRVAGMALMNAIPTAVTVFGATYATNRTYGVQMSTTTYLWISLCGNVFAVIFIPLFARLSDRIGRRQCIIAGSLTSGVLAFAYLNAVGQGDVVAAFVLAMLMWGIAYQAYNAVFPAFYSELFPGRARVSAFAVSLNGGVLVTALLPTVMTVAAPPGANVPIVVGYLTVACAAIAAIAAASARETNRVSLATGSGSPPVEKVERWSPPPVAERVRLPEVARFTPPPAMAGPPTSPFGRVPAPSAPEVEVSRKGGIFISYRRRDEPNFTGRLYDRLALRFGDDRVFMDIDSIELGVDFTEAIERSLRKCSVMLVIVGKDWLREVDAQARPRLANPADFVRLEIERGLSLPGVRVIPILVEDAVLPSASSLPPSLAALTKRNGIEMSHARFARDIDVLFRALDKVIDPR